ncbi:TPA: ankyrin repeat domain-containing protein [Escherichia coli]|nr:ankyrin repeat domain-containing protein [Escherichia coli]
MIFLLNVNDVKKAIQAGVDLNVQDHYRSTLLFDNFRKNDIASTRTKNIIKELVEIIDVNHINVDGETALFSENNLEIVKIFIDTGIDINIKNKKGFNAFATSKNDEVNELLINSGIEIDIESKDVKNLCLLTKSNMIIEKLLKSGFDINQKFKEGNILENKTIENIKFLLANGLVEENIDSVYGIDINILEFLINNKFFKNKLDDITQDFIKITTHAYFENEEEKENAFKKMYLLLKNNNNYVENEKDNKNKIYNMVKIAIEKEEIEEIMKGKTTKNIKSRL